MPVNKDPSGERWVDAEVEVPGTPEEVWKAIASGPGVSSWFVPTTMEEKEGGAINACFGPGMDSKATIKVWQPPHRLVADSRDDMAPGDPTVATEWIVEARDGGKCVVRVVHRWFTDSDKWDEQYEQTKQGWGVFFRILRLYLAHFKGQPCSPLQFMGMHSGTKEAAWEALTSGLGVGGAAAGQKVRSASGAPPFAAVVERVGEAANPEEMLLRLEEPAPGIAHMFAMAMGGQIYLPVRLFLYGGGAPAAAAQAEPVWQAWMGEKLPMG